MLHFAPSVQSKLLACLSHDHRPQQNSLRSNVFGTYRVRLST